MIKKKRQKRGFMAWVMTLMLLFSMFAPIPGALADTPDPVLEELEVTVSGIEEGGTIHSSTSIEVTVAFKVPVIGDGVDSYFKYNDEAPEILLSESFKLTAPVSLPLTHGEKPLGTVYLSNNAQGQAVAKIIFDGDADIFNPDLLPEGEYPYAGVYADFTLNLQYNGEYEEDAEGRRVVRILEKEYFLQMPGDIITYEVEKSYDEADIDWAAGTIEWTVTIKATKDTDPPTPIDLDGYVFKDNLNGVGDYVSGSFSLTGSDFDAGNLQIPDGTSNKLIYTFPADASGEQIIKFKTAIPEAKLTAGGDITNTAGLYLDDEDEALDSGEATVTIEKPAVTKSGVTNDVKDGTTYNPSGRTITWYIQVDPMGRTLNNLVIEDAIASGLGFASAQWQRLVDAETDSWENVSGKSWSDKPAENKYTIGDGIDYTGRLVLVTNVPNEVDVTTITTYNNQATVTWSGGGGGTTGSATTNNVGIDIGYHALSKNGTRTSDDITNHQITWTINVHMKGQNAADFKVYDLFVHNAATTDAQILAADNWPSGLTLGSNGVTRNNGQKFVPDSVVSDVTVTPINLEKDEEVIATLVEISGLQNTGNNEVVLKSQVLDPNIIAGNDGNQRVRNDASLYKGTAYRGQDNSSVLYENRILAKELLKRAEVGHDYDAEASINPNNRTTAAAEGFHYGYK